MEPRRWLTQAEAADYLGVTTRTIRRYISIGLLPASRIKGSRLIRINRAERRRAAAADPGSEVEGRALTAGK
jgi:excisionase family DNA binding protein